MLNNKYSEWAVDSRVSFSFYDLKGDVLCLSLFSVIMLQYRMFILNLAKVSNM